LLRDVLRGPLSKGGLGFDGYVTSDTGAVYDIYASDAHNYEGMSAEAGVALAVGASCDVDSGSEYMHYFDAAIAQVRGGGAAAL
jgi:beta-glucosidase-like glycosyl hydrolase